MPYMVYWMASFSVILDDPQPWFQGHVIIRHLISLISLIPFIMLLLKTKRPSTLTERNVRLSILLINSCFKYFTEIRYDTVYLTCSKKLTCRRFITSMDKATVHRQKLLSMADVDDWDVREDVGVHESRSVGVCRDDGGGSAESAQLQGQVRVPARVDDERLLQPAQAVQHYERRRQPRLEGLRHRYADRFRPQVNFFYLLASNCF